MGIVEYKDQAEMSVQLWMGKVGEEPCSCECRQVVEEDNYVPDRSAVLVLRRIDLNGEMVVREVGDFHPTGDEWDMALDSDSVLGFLKLSRHHELGTSSIATVQLTDRCLNPAKDVVPLEDGLSFISNLFANSEKGQPVFPPGVVLFLVKLWSKSNGVYLFSQFWR